MDGQIPQPQEQPQYQVPMPEMPQSHKPFAKKFWITILAILLVSASIYFLVFYKTCNGPINLNSESGQTLNQNHFVLKNGDIYYCQTYWEKAKKELSDMTFRNKNLSQDETWKTYRNEQYGFEFKYPIDWQVSTDGLRGISLTPNIKSNANLDAGKKPEFSVSVWSDDPWRGTNPYFNKPPAKDINGIPWLTYIGNDGVPGEAAPYDELWYEVKAKNIYYWIVAYPYSETDDFGINKIYDQIFSTFKFINLNNLFICGGEKNVQCPADSPNCLLDRSDIPGESGICFK